MIREEWQIQVGKNKHIISSEEMHLILYAGEARFVQLKDLVINPAFVADMVLLRKINSNQLESSKEEFVPVSDDRFKEFKAKALNKIGKKI